MRNYTFNFEVETMVNQFMAAMDDITVKRYNKDKEPQSQIKARFVYAPKQRVLADLLDKAQNLQLPVVAVYIGGITRDPNRVFNKIAGTHRAALDPTISRKILQPVPIDITLNMSILTRYQKDMDQIISNFVPYYDPYIIISWRTPAIPEQEIRSVVNWSGNIALTYPTDINSTVVARVQADTQFTLKGWMFKAEPKPDANIFNVYTTFSSLMDLSLEKNEYTTERFALSSQPQPSVIVS